MKATGLEYLGFKKKGDEFDYWYEITFKGHRFITNDNHFDEDDFHIGYDYKEQEETCWFNGNVKTHDRFMKLFQASTGYIFSINGHHKKTKE